ncbi:reverse transcriptase family protein [Pseudomonas citronellolis]|uniref:reverse transcriptase family protein n=1 Tax=Pseudomonas citronellolis TaxID=53408 RepID=UPI00209EE92F|nr:reverse transcriptase family protein [Pseudomonas citronellolis]MCP1602674.1 hypothetical protein [Pseudomonas citronellolis]MCP1653732.1 hypothetical protein [Pseudomonas citronellolis]MCP1720677.1 hypothetical protein [Pseudomonas citronellolis]
MDAPRYSYKAINSIKALSLMLGEPSDLLEKLALKADTMYRPVLLTKKDGTPRYAFDALEPLKRIQKKLVARIFTKVSYPSYLHGGIKDPLSPRSIYSNARVHVGAKTLILQDIKDFFPSIVSRHVYSIFRNCFGFGDVVSTILVKLTTKDGCVPQGACTSSYIANLVFWDVEPDLYRALSDKGIRYSRFADDITSSSLIELTNSEVSEVVSAVVAMLASKGCHQKRRKLNVRKGGQGFLSANGGYESLTITSLTVSNPDGVGVSQKERNRIRSFVKKIEVLAHVDTPWSEVEKLYQQAMGRVGRLIACNHREGERLKARLNTVKASYGSAANHVPASVHFSGTVVVDSDGSDIPPWE